LGNRALELFVPYCFTLWIRAKESSFWYHDLKKEEEDKILFSDTKNLLEFIANCIAVILTIFFKSYRRDRQTDTMIL
jgi:hypothetical protein